MIRILAYNILATHAIGISQAAARDLHKWYLIPRRKCFVHYNTIEDPLKEPLTPHNDLRGNPEERIICVAGGGRYKGQELLINAATILKSDFPHLKIRFIGATPERNQEFIKLAQDLGVANHCVFQGPVPHQEVLSYMAGASCLVVPSRDEAFGLINIEAMAVSTPVIATRVGGIPEIIIDGENGLLAPPEDPKALASKIAILLRDRSLREQLGENGREHFLRHFEQGRALQTYADWFESLLA